MRRTIEIAIAVLFCILLFVLGFPWLVPELLR